MESNHHHQRAVRVLGAWVAILMAMGLMAFPADAQSLTAGVKGGLPSPAFGGYGEVFLSPSWSMNLSVGVQSASATIASWSTVYLTGPRQPIAPYVGLGV